MSEIPHAYACILAGGSGERFWPMSRQRTPKHLLKLLSDRTLLEETVRRLEPLVGKKHLFVLTNVAQLEFTRAALQGILAPEQIIAEPAKRDTAAAAALATGLARAQDPKAIVALFPADAFIRDGAAFSRQLRAVFAHASETSALLTFAIKPTHASTSFGYLKLGDPVRDARAFRNVTRFVEKPDAATADKYVASGEYAWNAGMFVWRTESFLAEAEKHAPQLAKFIRDFPAGDATSYLAKTFPTLEPKTSVDYAILEKAQAVETMLAEFDWDDVGLWTALPPHLEKDANGNAIRGKVLATADATGNIAVSNGRVIGLVGVQDLVVVETADAILVCHKDKVGDIKQLVAKLPKDVV